MKIQLSVKPNLKEISKDVKTASLLAKLVFWGENTGTFHIDGIYVNIHNKLFIIYK